MTQPKFNFKVLGNYINGRFYHPKDTPFQINGEWVSKSPADFSDEIGRFYYSYAAIDEAVQASEKAFRKWRKTPFGERAEILKKYQSILKKREEEWTEAIAREVGKPAWESKTEVTSMINKVDISIQDGMKFIADFEIPNIADQIHGSCHYRPLGVMAVIGPFNFPGHLPNGHIIPALLTGNTVVFKPSEKTPMVGQLMAECFHEAGLPPGVFNLIQGEKEVGRRLCVHHGIAAVLFTGSYEVGMRIKQDTLQQHWKLLALEMGGKNAAIVWDDAQLDHAVLENLTGAFLTTGQRCSATSRVIVHHKLLDEFIHRFHSRAKAFSIGHPLDNPFMGPLIDSSSVDRYMKFLGIASREGCEVVMRGKSLDLPKQGNYVTPSICLAKSISLDQAQKSIYQQTELFAPNVVILGTQDLEEALALANATQYGLAASIFTQNRKTYEKCLDELEVGLVNWNKSTVGASSRLPFGGLKKSGNHFPTAVTAGQYCTSPVACMELSEPKSAQESALKMHGLNWN